MKISIPIVFCFLLVACKFTPTATLMETKPIKGELVFLLNYDKKLPSDVGFITNQIVQRRLANLLKQDFTIFIDQTKNETPIHVDTVNYVVYATFFSDSTHTKNIASVIVDVKQDAFWVNYEKEIPLEIAESPSIKKPVKWSY